MNVKLDIVITKEIHIYLNLYCDPLTPVYIGNLTTTLCYSGFRINDTGYLDIQNWTDEDFGVKSNSQYYREKVTGHMVMYVGLQK